MLPVDDRRHYYAVINLATLYVVVSYSLIRWRSTRILNVALLEYESGATYSLVQISQLSGIETSNFYVALYTILFIILIYFKIKLCEKG